jgi:hypothetical protein
MGLLLILLGVVLAGALADFLIENDVATAASQPMTMAGITVNLSAPVLAAIAFGMGALAVLLILGGIRRMRRKRRGTLQDRIARLEEENARLATHKNLPNVMRIPDSEPLAPPAPADVTAVPEPPQTPAGQPSQPSQPSGGPTSSRW